MASNDRRPNRRLAAAGGPRGWLARTCSISVVPDRGSEDEHHGRRVSRAHPAVLAATPHRTAGRQRPPRCRRQGRTLARPRPATPRSTFASFRQRVPRSYSPRHRARPRSFEQQPGAAGPAPVIGQPFFERGAVGVGQLVAAATSPAGHAAGPRAFGRCCRAGAASATSIAATPRRFPPGGAPPRPGRARAARRPGSAVWPRAAAPLPAAARLMSWRRSVSDRAWHPLRFEIASPGSSRLALQPAVAPSTGGSSGSSEPWLYRGSVRPRTPLASASCADVRCVPRSGSNTCFVEDTPPSPSTSRSASAGHCRGCDAAPPRSRAWSRTASWKCVTASAARPFSMRALPSLVRAGWVPGGNRRCGGSA